jgi:hypothetical protein
MSYLGTKPANSPLTSELIPDGIITPADLSQGKPVWDANGNVGIGTSSPASRLTVAGNTEIRSGSGVYLGDSTNVSFPSLYSPAINNIAFRLNSGSETMRITDNSLLQFNSGYGSVATAYGCRAWVNFNGTGTVAIRASGNVSSITDNGTGDYTVNFATAMADANYQVSGIGCSSTSNAFGFISLGTAVPNGTDPTASLVRVRTTTSNGGSYADVPFVNVAIHR